MRRTLGPRTHGLTAAVVLAVFLTLSGSCRSDRLPALPAIPPGAFAFGVIGDTPYFSMEAGRFQRAIEDIDRADVRFLIHVGDILWQPCSEQVYEEQRRYMNEVRCPVIYTPGDNEWTDCHRWIAGGYAPLERLGSLRRVFFADPRRSLGRETMPLVSQADMKGFEEFVENRRWIAGASVFATVHIVGSDNGFRPYRGRTAVEDGAVERRTQAGLRWIDEAFAQANALSARAVFLAFHGDPGYRRPSRTSRGYLAFLDRLRAQVAAFKGSVVAIHGDGHHQYVDHPLRDPSGRTYPNFTRIETFGSPDVGWVRVVVDSSTGRILWCEPRLMRVWR